MAPTSTPAAPAEPAEPTGPHARLLRDRRLLWLLVAVGVMALVVVAAVQFSGAYFTSSSRSPGNQFAAATMSLELAEDGQLLDGDGMLPGDSRSGTQTVTNTGHQGRLTLTARDVAKTSLLARALRVTVRQTSPPATAPAYDGPLTDMDRVDLGLMATDEPRTWSITVTWPASEDDPALAGSSTTLDFRWTLESVP